ncbi:MAG: STAS domain-containing protein [Mariprofundus sp.]|nr:STAS domain-containing protein [Mariprofundus sp.]
MNTSTQGHTDQMLIIADLFNKEQEVILKLWMLQQMKANSLRSDLISQEEMQQMSLETLQGISKAIEAGNMDDISAPGFKTAKANLQQVSERYALLGFSPSETATFIFSLKEALLNLLQQKYSDNTEALFAGIMLSNKLVDILGLYTFECFADTQKAMISEQISAMSAMSTPVMQIWKDVLMIPIVGTVDSSRSQEIMDAMLEGLTHTDSEIIILDIQGVASIDSAVANHLLKITKAVTMMGCHCIVSGVTSHVAQAMANLGLDLGRVNSAPTLRKGLRMALATLHELQAQGNMDAV